MGRQAHAPQVQAISQAAVVVSALHPCVRKAVGFRISDTISQEIRISHCCFSVES